LTNVFSEIEKRLSFRISVEGNTFEQYFSNSFLWKKTVDFIIYNSGENQKTYRDRTFGTPGISMKKTLMQVENLIQDGQNMKNVFYLLLIMLQTTLQ